MESDLHLSCLSTLHPKSQQFYLRPYVYLSFAFLICKRDMPTVPLSKDCRKNCTSSQGAGSWWPPSHPQRAFLPHPPEVVEWEAGVEWALTSNCPPLPGGRVCVGLGLCVGNGVKGGLGSGV